MTLPCAMFGSMGAGEWMTRGTVWLALSLYTASEIAGCGPPKGWWRWLHTAGCAVFLGHVVCAFTFYHQWSHAIAYAETARQTSQLTGWNWGGGLYINYAFAFVWLGETVWSWAAPAGYLNRPAWMTRVVKGFFLFMIFNGAVVFVHEPARWYGLSLCLILVFCRCRTGIAARSTS